MISYFLMALLQRTPLLLVILVGIILSIARWKRHPKASLLTLIALGFYLIKLFAFTALNYWIPSLRESMNWSFAALNNLFTVLHVVNDIGFAVVTVLLVTAAFANRAPEAATSS
jgi:hypothetical protein